MHLPIRLIHQLISFRTVSPTVNSRVLYQRVRSHTEIFVTNTFYLIENQISDFTKMI